MNEQTEQERPTVTSAESHHRGVVSFVNRGGRMTVGQQRAWERRWHEMGREVAALGTLDLDAWFGRHAPVLLEIGPGMGETTVALAGEQPATNYLAVDVYQPGLAALIMRAESLGVHNLRLLRGDAVRLLREHIASDSLAGTRIFFPDPWPKARHHKRRLIQPGFVSLLASRLAEGAVLHMATDWEDYAEHMLRTCSAEPRLRNVHEHWAPRPSWRPVTKFERRAENEGRACQDLMFARV